jgi:TRAP-type C4-dicarboxylate transport system substrate-binding protein
MYEPVLMSKKVFDGLEPRQREAILAAAKKAEAYFFEEAKKGEQKMRDVYTKAGVEVVTMTPEDYQAWMAVAKHSSYRLFAEKVKGGDELLRKALAVQ